MNVHVPDGTTQISHCRASTQTATAHESLEIFITCINALGTGMAMVVYSRKHDVLVYIHVYMVVGTLRPIAMRSLTRYCRLRSHILPPIPTISSNDPRVTTCDPGDIDASRPLFERGVSRSHQRGLRICCGGRGGDHQPDQQL